MSLSRVGQFGRVPSFPPLALPALAAPNHS